MSEDLSYSQYKETYKKLGSLSINEDNKNKISSILSRAYVLGEAVPDIKSYQKMTSQKLETILEKYDKEYHLLRGQAGFGNHLPKELSLGTMMSEIYDESPCYT